MNRKTMMFDCSDIPGLCSSSLTICGCAKLQKKLNTLVTIRQSMVQASNGATDVDYDGTPVRSGAHEDFFSYFALDFSKEMTKSTISQLNVFQNHRSILVVSQIFQAKVLLVTRSRWPLAPVRSQGSSSKIGRRRTKCRRAKCRH